MMAKIQGTLADPLTNRKISDNCWNGRHEEPESEMWIGDCKRAGCECMCHDHDPLGKRMG